MPTLRSIAGHLPQPVKDGLRSILGMRRPADVAAGAWEPTAERPLDAWLAARRPSPAELEAQRAASAALRAEVAAARGAEQGADGAGDGTDTGAPLFSIVVPLYRTPAAYLRDAVESVLAQSFPDFELVLVDSTPGYRDECEKGGTDGPAGPNPDLGALVGAYAARDGRVVEVRPEESAPHGIVANTNLGVARARGEVVCFMDHDDVLEPDALFAYAQALRDRPDADVLYCDEDIFETLPDGSRRGLHALLKPCYSPELLMCKQYVLHLMAVRREVLATFMPLDEAFEGAQDYEMALRACDAARAVVNVPRLLYHWRQGAGSTAADPAAKVYGRKPYLLAAAGRLRRLGSDAALVNAGAINVHRPWFTAPAGAPRVCVVAAVRGEAEERWCREAFSQTVRCAGAELAVVDTGDGPQAMTRFEAWNEGASRTDADYLVFTTGGARFASPQPLEQLLGTLRLPGVGAVGPQALYADMTLHSNGIALTPEAVLPLYRGVRHDHACYLCDAISLEDHSAVAGHGLTVRRDLFRELGGFDARFRGEMAAADLCARVRARGLRVVSNPAVRLQLEDACPEPRFSEEPQPDFPAAEVAAFDAKHPGLRAGGDPYFNPNFDQSWAWCALPRRRA